MKASALVGLLILVAGCAPPRAYPTDGVAVNTAGNTSAAAGVNTGRVVVGANTKGDVGAAVNVVDRPNVDVTVGTGGSSVAVGNGPVRFGIGTGGRGGLTLWF